MRVGCLSAVAGVVALIYSQAFLQALLCYGRCLQPKVTMGLADFVLLSYAGVVLIALGVGLFSLFSIVFAAQWKRARDARVDHLQ
jgi:hypothetical protein